MILKLVLLSALFSALQVNSENILVFIGGGTYSHKLSIWPLVDALTERGHNVTVLSAHKKKPSKNPKVHDLFSTALYEMTASIYEVNRVQERIDGQHLKILDSYNTDTVSSCEVIMFSKNDASLQYIVHEGQFDLIINNHILGECGFIIAHQKKTKLITFASTPFIPWFHDEFGLPDEAATIPDMRVVDRFPMNMWTRFRNYLAPLYWFLSRRLSVYPKLEEIMQKAYDLRPEDVPAFKDIHNINLVLMASHYSTGFASSYPPFIVDVGGMQCFLPTEPLTGEFKTVLDKAVDGAVLIAFGSTVNLATMPVEIKSSFLAMMRKFPKITFIWRWDGPEPENKPENLIISKWLPQFQILGHPNLKAFVSHAGLNSLSEATYHGVPVILMPLFADQDYNGYRIEATEIGIRLEMREITTEVMVESMDQILSNSKYSKNMKAMSAMFKDRPMNPIDTAVYWTEFALRHEDFSSLKPLQNVTFFQRRLLDILLAIIVTVVVVTVLLHNAFLWAVSKRKNRHASTTKQNGAPKKKPVRKNNVDENWKTK